MTGRKADVDAKLPLALLEAVRRQDTPEDWLPDENPASAFPHRLGLSRVIDGQVRRLHRLARKRQRVDETEVEALLELISRRRDAPQIFAAAGRRLARYYFAGLPGFFRRTSRRLPQRLRERALVRTLRTANGALLPARELAVDRAPLRVRARGALTARVPGAGSACQLYGAFAAQLLEMAGADSVRVEHTQCQGRGDADCVWEVLADGSQPSRRDPEPVSEPQCSSLGST
ncbi:MAG: hypothetical protein PVJ43_07620 [Gemmatimonadales bacterium]|jgi:hypothetical protein